MGTVWIHELFWPDIDRYLREGGETALVPIGATEQHGHHTPLFVDTGWAISVSEEVAKSTGVLVSPPLHFGYSQHHLAYPGGITLRAETLTSVAIDVAESLISHGFKKIIFVNGNRIANLPPLQIAMTKLRYKTGAFVAIIDTHLIARRAVCEIAGNKPDASNHAGFVETSFMMAKYPDFVRAGAMEATPAHPSPRFSAMYPMDPPFDADVAFTQITASEFRQKTHDRGVYSDPSAANAEQGAQILKATIDHAVEFVRGITALHVDCPRCPIPV